MPGNSAGLAAGVVQPGWVDPAWHQMQARLAAMAGGSWYSVGSEALGPKVEEGGDLERSHEELVARQD